MSNWKKLSSEVKIKTPIYEVIEDTVIQPDGKTSSYTRFHFYHNGVAILPIESNGMYLIQNFRYPLDTFSLEIPSGAIQDGSSTLDSAKEELLEETGFTASMWTKLNDIYRFPSRTNVHDTFFLAEDLVKGERHLDGNESIREPKWYSFADLIRMVNQGKIYDAATQTGIFLAFHYFQR